MKSMIQKTVLLIAAVCTLSTGFVAQSASAYISDPTTVSRLQSAKNDLLIRESQLLRDQDDLTKQIWDLKRTTDPRAKYILNDLTQKLDSKYDQLKKTRWELRQVELALL